MNKAPGPQIGSDQRGREEEEEDSNLFTSSSSPSCGPSPGPPTTPWFIPSDLFSPSEVPAWPPHPFPLRVHTHTHTARPLNSWWLSFMAARGLTLPCFSSSSTALMLETQISVVWFQIIPESLLCCGGVLRPVRSACFSSQVLFCRDKRGHGPMAADKNAKQPWPDQTGSPRCYLPACSTVLVPWGKKVKEPGMKLAGVSATAARCLTLRGKGGFQPLKGEKWPRLHIVWGVWCCSTHRLNEDTFLIQFPKWNLAAGMNFKLWLIPPK